MADADWGAEHEHKTNVIGLAVSGRNISYFMNNLRSFQVSLKELNKSFVEQTNPDLRKVYANIC